MAINTILWDVDGTLLDFDLAETNALRECMDRYHVAVSDTQLMVYKRINRELWEMLERGEITKTRLGPERFRKFLEYILNHRPTDDFTKAIDKRVNELKGQNSSFKTGTADCKNF